jgi:hypothetical protein
MPRAGPVPPSYIELPTFEMIVLIWPPRKMSATIEMIAMRARIRGVFGEALAGGVVDRD